MRLIDADELMNELMKARWAYQMLDDTWAADKAMGGLRAAEQRVKDAPTIDAVPVVRCKDCKYRKVSEYHYKDIGYRTTECTRGNEGVIGTCEDNGYCSDGERKAEP